MRPRGAAALAAVLVVLGLTAACGGGEDVDLGGTDDSTVASSDATSSSTAAPGEQDDTTTSTTDAAEDDDTEVEVTISLPEGWPDDLPIPDDAEVELGQRTEQADGRVLLTVDFVVPDGGANVYTAFLRALEQDSGTTILQRSSGSTDTGFVGSISFGRDDYSGNVAVDGVDAETVLTVSVVLDEG